MYAFVMHLRRKSEAVFEAVGKTAFMELEQSNQIENVCSLWKQIRKWREVNMTGKHI